MKIPVKEAKNNLSLYGDLAHNGESITVSKHGKPWFDIVPHTVRSRDAEPLPGIKSTVSEQDAIAPLEAEDLSGWM